MSFLNTILQNKAHGMQDACVVCARARLLGEWSNYLIDMEILDMLYSVDFMVELNNISGIVKFEWPFIFKC